MESAFVAITQLELKTFERLPILLRTEVTNQPAGATASIEDVEPNQPFCVAQRHLLGSE